MFRRSLLILFAAALSVTFAADRKTLFIDKMGGFEKYVEEAIRQTEARVEFIEEQEHPDLKILLGKQFTSVSAEILYQKNTGRRGETILKAVDVKTGKEIASHSFVMQDDDNSKKRNAVAFASLLKSKLP